MSISLSAAAIAQFDAEVKHAYQGSGILRNSVRVRTGVVGSTHRFPKMGKGVASQRVPQTDVVPMNVSHTNQTATLTDWAAPEYTDIFNQAKVNFDERRELASVIAGAIGRREDQLILDALDAASTTLTVAKTIGTTTGMETTKVRRAKGLLDNQGVPIGRGERSLVISAQGMEQLLGDSDANTVDKNMIKTLFDGEMSHWVGFDIMQMEERTEGGLPVDATPDRTCYAYHKAAIGLAVGIDFRTEVNYIPEKTSWLANGLFSAGSVDVDALGIVEIAITEL